MPWFSRSAGAHHRLPHRGAAASSLVSRTLRRNLMSEVPPISFLRFFLHPVMSLWRCGRNGILTFILIYPHIPSPSLFLSIFHIKSSTPRGSANVVILERACWVALLRPIYAEVSCWEQWRAELMLSALHKTLISFQGFVHSVIIIIIILCNTAHMADQCFVLYTSFHLTTPII